jgi:hypothetical protein
MTAARLVLTALFLGASTIVAAAPPPDVVFKDGFDCGNAIQEGVEDCDGNDLGGQSCEDFGFLTGFLACTGSCTFDFDGCSNCGNAQIDDGEVCDGADLGGQTCQSQGFSSGTLACGGNCTSFDTSGCVP